MNLRKLYPIVALLLALAVLVSACAPAATPTPKPVAVKPTAVAATAVPATAVAVKPAGKTSFYFVYVPKLVHPWYDDVKAGIDAAIKEMTALGYTIKYDWDAPPQGDVVLHTQRIEAAIAKKPDALCVSCLDSDADKALIEQAQKAGIPVFGFDTPCVNNDLVNFAGHTDCTPDGADMAETLAKAMGGKGEVAILMGSPGAANHQQRVAGFKAVLASKYPNIKVVAEEYDNDDLERAVNLTASMLQAHPNLGGVFGANATAPIGAGRAIVEAGKKGKVLLVGMDDLPEMVGFVKDGTALAMSLQHVPDIGYWSIKYMVAYGRGLTVPKVHDTGSFVVDKSTVETYKAK
jgi:ribose transport system substrate-binding protein